jgi:thiamine-monophosphate kinase
MASEFDLIARYFSRPVRTASLGVGDDAALIRTAPGAELAVSSDMLVSGRHFFPDVDPVRLGHKALAVNLSDLAAMGAAPKWALLSLALPEADDAWLSGFAEGFFSMADRFGVELVGGDTTCGPLNISVTIMGEVVAGQALRRDGARPGDDVWVSGELGGAALAVRHALGEADLAPDEAVYCRDRLEIPEPRIALGLDLLGLAHAAIDVSDGLAADLGHILERSSLGADIVLSSLPVAAPVRARLPGALACLLAGGDDYELCFTAAPERAPQILAVAAKARVAVSRIGRIVGRPGLQVLGPDGLPLVMEVTGFDHFAT